MLHKMEVMTTPTSVVAYVCAYVFMLNRLNNIQINLAYSMASAYLYLAAPPLGQSSQHPKY